jgi:hypothetical protein
LQSRPLRTAPVRRWLLATQDRLFLKVARFGLLGDRIDVRFGRQSVQQGMKIGSGAREPRTVGRKIALDAHKLGRDRSHSTRQVPSVRIATLEHYENKDAPRRRNGCQNVKGAPFTIACAEMARIRGCGNKGVKASVQS